METDNRSFIERWGHIGAMAAMGTCTFAIILSGLKSKQLSEEIHNPREEIVMFQKETQSKTRMNVNRPSSIRTFSSPSLSNNTFSVSFETTDKTTEFLISKNGETREFVGDNPKMQPGKIYKVKVHTDGNGDLHLDSITSPSWTEKADFEAGLKQAKAQTPANEKNNGWDRS